MKVFVTGATGVVGRRAVAQLVTAKHAVTAVARTVEKAAMLRQLGARPIEVDLFDATAVREAVAEHEAVVNLATHIPPIDKSMAVKHWAVNDRLRRDASAHLVDGAIAGSATRFIQESITFPYVDGGEEWIDEDRPREYVRVMQSSVDAEAQAARFSAAGRVGIVLRFSMFCAPESTHGQALLNYFKYRVAPVLGKPTSFVSWIHADDAASAVVAALQAPAGIYNVSEDEPLRRRDLADTLAAVLGYDRPFFVPASLLALGGGTVRALMRSQRISNAQFKKATGWSPRYRSAIQGWGAPSPAVARNEHLLRVD